MADIRDSYSKRLKNNNLMKNQLKQLLFSEDKEKIKIAIELGKEEPAKTEFEKLAPQLIELLLFSLNRKKIDLAFELGKEAPFKTYLEHYIIPFTEDLKSADFETLEVYGVRRDDDALEIYKRYLLIDNASIETFSDIDEHMRQWRKLDLENSKIETLPSWLGMFKELEIINAQDSFFLEEIEEGFYDSKSLKELNLRCTPLKFISSDIRKIQTLCHLDLTGCECEIPKEIGALKNLKHLDLCETSLEEIPAEFYKLESLEYWDMNYTSIEYLSGEIKNLSLLKYLNISRTEINSLPKSIEKLEKLEVLILNGKCLINSIDVLLNLLNIKELKFYKINDIDFKIVDENLRKLKGRFPNSTIEFIT